MQIRAFLFLGIRVIKISAVLADVVTGKQKKLPFLILFSKIQLKNAIIPHSFPDR